MRSLAILLLVLIPVSASAEDGAKLFTPCRACHSLDPADQGLPGFRSITWFAMVGPPGMPAALADRINRDVLEILQRPAVSAKLRELRLEPMIGTPTDAAKFFAEETALWGGVIREANVTVQ